MALKILWIKTSPLHPLTRGGDLRSFHMLRWLHQKHHVTYAGLLSNESQRQGSNGWPEYASAAHWTQHRGAPEKTSAGFYLGAVINALAHRQPYAVSRFRSRAWQAQIARLLQEQTFDLLVCDFIFPSASLPWDQLRQPGAPALLLFQHNVESYIWQRRLQHASRLSRFYWRSQWRRMERFERQASARFHGIVAVSAEDASWFREHYRLPNILGHVVTGVDAGYFHGVGRSLEKPPKVVFLGSMDWHANVDAVLDFAAHAWPLVRTAVPDARLQIIGRSPVPSIKRLAQSPGIEVTGTVPDVRPWLRQADVMIVPLRIGGGTRIKIFEAMAAEVPVVSTRIGAEGLPVEHGRDLLLADAPADFAREVIRVIQYPALGRQLAAHALQRVLRDHTWDAAASTFEGYCEQTVHCTR